MKLFWNIIVIRCSNFTNRYYSYRQANSRSQDVSKFDSDFVIFEVFVQFWAMVQNAPV